MKIAIIGTGIAGNGAAWLLNKAHDITVFEKNDRIGGHSNTAITPSGVPVDTGFIVYNTPTYPNFVNLMDHLGVQTQDSDMSFAVSFDDGDYEYAGSLAGLFAQRENILRLSHYRMIRDLMRFYKTVDGVLDDPNIDPSLSLGEYLDQNGYSKPFIDRHLLPMGAAIWSMTCEDMRAFPLISFARFFKNHGLLKLKDRPIWRTVTGGSKSYVAALTKNHADKIRLSAGVKKVVRQKDGVKVMDETGFEDVFDHVVFASHADETLKMIDAPTAAEQKVLGAFSYSTNRALLHTDAKLMPIRRAVWSSWNYMTDTSATEAHVAVSYWMNRLQGLPPEEDIFVTLNPLTEPDADKVIGEYSYTHPQFDKGALEQQGQIGSIQGRDRLWFCGSYCGYGFHEDGLASGLAVAEDLGGTKRPWMCEESSVAGPNARALAIQAEKNVA